MLLLPCTVLSPRHWVQPPPDTLPDSWLWLRESVCHSPGPSTHMGWSQSCRVPDQAFPWFLGDSCPERAPTYTECGIESIVLQTTRLLVKYDLKPAPNHSLTPLWSLSLIFVPPLQLHSNHERATGLSTPLPPLGYPLPFSYYSLWPKYFVQIIILLISFVRRKYLH